MLPSITKPISYQCRVCAKAYKTRKNATKHARQAHGYRVAVLPRYGS